jgi:hypothetical protein
MAFRHKDWCACDMMIDWVTSRSRGVRPLSLIGPSAPRAGPRWWRGLTADWQELAAVGDPIAVTADRIRTHPAHLNERPLWTVGVVRRW